MAAATSSLGEQIREELTCSICLELFTRPKVLPCQHTFCQDCLEVHARKEGISECPNCRQKVTLPGEGVAGLPDNVMAASMCERLKQETTQSGETSEQPRPGKKCNVHSSEVKLYCKQCQIPVCEQCLEETHDDHRTTTIKKAAQERSSTVQALINEGRNILGGYYSFIRGLGETEDYLNKKKQQRDNSIIQAYDKMVQKLTERKDQLLTEAEENHKKNLKKIEDGRDSVSSDVNELSAACDQAEQEMQQNGFEFLIQGTASTAVLGKYRGKAAPTPVQTQPAVFQPTDTPVPVLGHVTAEGTGHHQGNQKQEEPQSDRLTFGGRGSGTGQFKDPVGVAISDEGEIFVADRENQRIQVFTLQGTFVRQFQTVLSGGQFQRTYVPGSDHLPVRVQKMDPQDIAMDREGNLWVVGWTESAEFAVRYDTRGTVEWKIDLKTTGGRGVAVDTRRNHILITQTTCTEDGGNTRGEVQVFRPDGTLVKTVGKQQGMKDPCSVAVGREGNILVSDRGNHCMYAYDEYGQFLFQCRREDIDVFDKVHLIMNSPRGICTDRAGNIIVADTDNNCVKMFDKKAEFLRDIAKDIEQPWAVAMATEGPLVVTDGLTDTVTIFNKF